jgi:hypothetical protein
LSIREKFVIHTRENDLSRNVMLDLGHSPVEPLLVQRVYQDGAEGSITDGSFALSGKGSGH